MKTYPTLSVKYEEVVCTAGLSEDGSWIRIYPIPFRKLDYEKQYKKHDWVEIDLVRHRSDFRPESYRPYSIDTPIRHTGHLDATGNWKERKELVLQNVHYDLSGLIQQAKDSEICTSLATYRPEEVLEFIAKETDREWDKIKIAKLRASRAQGNLFEYPEDPFQGMKKLPYKFQYKLKDRNGEVHQLMILDWEIGALYWKVLAKHEGDEERAIADVRKKYWDDFVKTKDLFFFLGTTKSHHYTSHNPFLIIGTFTPKKEEPGLFQ